MSYSFHVYHDQVITNDKDFSEFNDWYVSSTIKPNDPSVCKQMMRDEVCIWHNLNKRRHTLISGIAGSGKSHLLQRFIKHIQEHTDLKVRVTAPTGIAANNVGGETIYRALGLGLAADSPEELWKRVQKKLFGKNRNNGKALDSTLEFLELTDVLIIDEISMLTPHFLEVLDVLLRRVKNKPLVPFGGVILVMCGDFLQLGPIETHESKPFAFCSESFSNIPLGRIHLCHNYRQGDTSPFLDILNAIRIGELTPVQVRILQTRLISNVGPPPDNSVHLYCRKNDVETLNNRKLSKLVSPTNPLFEFKGTHVIRPRPFITFPISKKEKELAASKVTDKFLEDNFVVKDVVACVGAVMMIRTNHFFNQNLFNGSIVKVIRINQTIIHVHDSSGKEHEIPKVTFTKALTSHLEVAMEQFPLCLSWAMTIHKSQGLTLDSITIDLSNGFSPGQMYVGLTRDRELKDLYLINFKHHSLFVHEKAIAFENVLNPFSLPKLETVPNTITSSRSDSIKTSHNDVSPNSNQYQDPIIQIHNDVSPNSKQNQDPTQVKGPLPIKVGGLRDILMKISQQSNK